MGINKLLLQVGEWLKGTGPYSDIVISSRIRLARNLERFPFLPKATQKERGAIEEYIRTRLQRVLRNDKLVYINLNQTSPLDRYFLVERHLISKEHAQGGGERAVAFGEEETFSIMINEEDHLRIQVLRSGLQLDKVWDEIDPVDDQLNEELIFAFSRRFGYLTACPTNLGTGLRASVMLHLPVLQMTKQIEKVFQTVTKINLSVRGFFGEGSQAMGNFYQISNQMTLGIQELDILKKINEVVPQIVKYERNVRDALIKENKSSLEDHIWRAYGALRNARTISSEETMGHLSAIRMGVNLGLLDKITIKDVNELFIMTQPAHLQKLEGKTLTPTERDVARASFIRQKINGTNN